MAWWVLPVLVGPSSARRAAGASGGDRDGEGTGGRRSIPAFAPRGNAGEAVRVMLAPRGGLDLCACDGRSGARREVFRSMPTRWLRLPALTERTSGPLWR